MNQSRWTRILEANLSEQIQCRGINRTAILRLKVFPDRIRGSEGHLYYRAGVQEPAQVRLIQRDGRRAREQWSESIDRLTILISRRVESVFHRLCCERGQSFDSNETALFASSVFAIQEAQSTDRLIESAPRALLILDEVSLTLADVLRNQLIAGSLEVSGKQRNAFDVG